MPTTFSIQRSAIFGVPAAAAARRQPGTLPASLHRHGHRRHTHQGGSGFDASFFAVLGSLWQHTLPVSGLRPWRDSPVLLQVGPVPMTDPPVYQDASGSVAAAAFGSLNATILLQLNCFKTCSRTLGEAPSASVLVDIEALVFLTSSLISFRAEY